MSAADRGLSDAARTLLDRHLDAVERVLDEAGVSRSERRAICDEVETQACEMAWRRAEGEPTEQHIKAVLAELDDPEAYRTAAEPAAPKTAARALEAGPQVHKFALWAFLLPPAEFVLLFTPFHPKGEGPTYVCFAVVSFVCIVFAALAIRDIRRQPDRYCGVALAVFGALAFPLLVLNTLVVVNVSELDPWGITKVQVKQHIIKFEDEVRQRHVARHGPDVPFEQLMPRLPPDSPLSESERKRIAEQIEELPEQTAPLTESEQWIAKHATTLDILNHVVIIGSSLAFSALLFFLVYRCCRPRSLT